MTREIVILNFPQGIRVNVSSSVCSVARRSRSYATFLVELEFHEFTIFAEQCVA